MYLEVLRAELGIIYAFDIAIEQTYNIFVTSNKCLLLKKINKVFTRRKLFSEYKDKGCFLCERITTQTGLCITQSLAVR